MSVSNCNRDGGGCSIPIAFGWNSQNLLQNNKLVV